MEELQKFKMDTTVYVQYYLFTLSNCLLRLDQAADYVYVDRRHVE